VVCLDLNSEEGTCRRKLASMNRVARPAELVTVLIVDDEPSVTEMLQDILEAHAYRAISTNNPALVLALLSNDPRPIDLLLVDVIMPQMPGRDLAELVQQRWPNCKVIFISGYALERLPEPGVPPGSPILMKPIAIPALLDAVRTALGAEGK
jgi:two-component system cell cycle sensor histidine kinase/response regulator CckA